MEYRILGKTGLKVSVLGYGCSFLGDMYEGRLDVAEAGKAMRYAIDNGVNLFDVSPYYGPDALAETRLGDVLRDVSRDRIVLATKVGQSNVGGKTVHDYSKAGVFQSIEESLRRLRTDYIDIYQVHDIHFTTTDQVINETIPAMRTLREQGKIRHIGITDYYLKSLTEIMEQAEIETVLSFCCYNLVDTSLATILAPVAQPKRIGIINASPLHMGLLASAPRRLAEAARRQNKLTRAVADAARYCEAHGTTIPDLAMRFVYAYDRIATNLSGMIETQHVERNLAAIGKKPDPDILSHVTRMITDAYDVKDPFGFRDE